jgi:hypothetical protein
LQLKQVFKFIPNEMEQSTLSWGGCLEIKFDGERIAGQAAITQKQKTDWQEFSWPSCA